MGKWFLYGIATALTGMFLFLSYKDQTSLDYAINPGWYLLMGGVVAGVGSAAVGVSVTFKKKNGTKDE